MGQQVRSVSEPDFTIKKNSVWDRLNKILNEEMPSYLLVCYYITKQRLETTRLQSEKGGKTERGYIGTYFSVTYQYSDGKAPLLSGFWNS